MKMYLAGDYSIHRGDDRIDVGILVDRLASYDYQKPMIDRLVDWKQKEMDLFLGGTEKFGNGEREYLMDLFLVGYEKKNIMKDIATHPYVNTLFNYVDGKTATDKYKKPEKAKLFIDSGAFSAWTKGNVIDVDEYIDWLNARSKHIDLFGQVDTIPGNKSGGKTTIKDVEIAAQSTWENYLYMRERVINKDGLLYTYHVGEPITFLKQALEWKDENGEHIKYIALGGMVGKPKRLRNSFLNNCFVCIRESSNPNVKTHAFGMTDFELLNRYPLTSADSTSWIMVGANGNIMSDIGVVTVSTKQAHTKTFYQHLPKHSQEALTKEVCKYGFTLEELGNDRDARIVHNGRFMLERAHNIKHDNCRIKKGLF